MTENFDSEFLKGLGIRAYKPHTGEDPQHSDSVNLRWPEEAVELFGVSKSVLEEWERMGELPESEWQGGSVKVLESHHIAALRKLKEDYASASITQQELLQERALSRVIRETTVKLQKTRWEISKRLSCGAAVEDGPLNAKFDAKGALLVR